ncbi:ATP-binding cassette domain-containing protein [Candidatus Pelagibacter sp.]|uniref:ATP-binding cassette domain-containing protein n=1 Tax=Candidatus Pelagibacter sp. TaxID=2024849 RepID=UPI003F87FB65
MREFKKFWFFLSNKEKINFFLIVFFAIIQAFLELISIAAVIPFITFLLKPEELNNYQFFSDFLYSINFLEHENFIVVLCLVFCAIFLIKNIFIVLINKKTFEFIFKFRTSLHIDLLNKVLHQNYLFFVNQGFSKINNILSEEINNYSVNTVKPTINLFREIIICIGLFLLVTYTGHLENLIFIIPFIFLIILILKKINRSIQDWSKTRIQNKENLVKLKYGLIHGVKEILISGRITNLIKHFNKNYISLQGIDIKNNTISTYPKALLEQTVIFIFILIIIFMNSSGDNFDDTIIILGFYLAVSYRLLPAINNIAVSNQQLKFGKPSHDKILEYFLLEKKNIFFDKSKENVLDFNDNIKLENIFFSYKNDNLFESLNLRIDKNEIIGIYGESGTGKSTLLNILVNLIKPQKGNIYLDDKLISDKFNIRKYQNLFSIVTQESFLINETILENIVIDKNNFDRKKLEESLKFASLNETINSLESGLNTRVGMALKKLSSGQKQRIAIARAYYSDREILVLDEATNALDEKNEKKIFENIQKLKNQKTVIIISHKTENLKICDKVYFVNEKKIKLKN